MEAKQRPDLMKVPFDAEQAAAVRRQWSEFLDAPEEITNSVGIKLALIPPGEYQMGGQLSLEPVRDSRMHRVIISRPFYIGAYEVTQQQYRAVTGNRPSYHMPGKREVPDGSDTDKFPVEMITWYDAVDFCKKLSSLPREKKSGRVYRLPTEAEWEYACRAGTTTDTHFGDWGDESKANHSLEKRLFGAPKAVGSYPPNAFGLYDMHGNVAEWCHDWYADEYYEKSPVQDPPGPPRGTMRVHRGGHYSSSIGIYSFERGSLGPQEKVFRIGMRVVCDVSSRVR